MPCVVEVMRRPTLEVEVAKPFTVRPVRVVVPKPEPEMVSADVDVVAVPATVVVDRNRSPPAFRNAHCAIPVPAESASCEPVVEAIVRRPIEGVVVPMPK